MLFGRGKRILMMIEQKSDNHIHRRPTTVRRARTSAVVASPSEELFRVMDPDSGDGL